MVTRQDSKRRQSEKALQARNRGATDKELPVFHELNNLDMDINARTFPRCWAGTGSMRRPTRRSVAAQKSERKYGCS